MLFHAFYSQARGEPRLKLGKHVFGIMWKFFEIHLNAPLSIIFYLKMKVEVLVGVHDIRPRFTPRSQVLGKNHHLLIFNFIIGKKEKN